MDWSSSRRSRTSVHKSSLSTGNASTSLGTICILSGVVQRRQFSTSAYLKILARKDRLWVISQRFEFITPTDQSQKLKSNSRTCCPSPRTMIQSSRLQSPQNMEQDSSFRPTDSAIYAKYHRRQHFSWKVDYDSIHKPDATMKM